MFQSVRFAEMLQVPPPAEPEHIIRIMLGRNLDFDPGERYAYSNFGYCLLGRVIEAVTGIRYEQYVRDQVLASLGIHSMRLGRTRLEERCGRAKSIPIRARPVLLATWATGAAPPRCVYLEAMDAHGGWLASALDLARFATAFDDPDRCPILRVSIEQMYAWPPGSAGYGEAEAVYYSWAGKPRTDTAPDQSLAHRFRPAPSPSSSADMTGNLVALLNSRESPRTDS
jgi:N-acyl-D-amino-acid deacylase